MAALMLLYVLALDPHTPSQAMRQCTKVRFPSPEGILVQKSNLIPSPERMRLDF